MNNLKCAKEIRILADDWRSRADSAYSKRHGLVNVYRADALNLREVATALENGQIEKAADMADSLDTIVRDLIPDDCWEYLQKHVNV